MSVIKYRRTNYSPVQLAHFKVAVALTKVQVHSHITSRGLSKLVDFINRIDTPELLGAIWDSKGGKGKLRSFKQMKRIARKTIPDIWLVAAFENIETEEITIIEPCHSLPGRKKFPRDKWRVLYEITYLKVSAHILH